MGHQVAAKCLKCGRSFKLDRGGGFIYHLVRCDKCGKTKAIGFDDLGQLHLRYVKGLPGPYCIATADHDEHIRKNVPVEPISEDEYHKGIEAIAGKCKCRGKYTLDAPARCPLCHSKRIKEGEITTLYD
jgi:predicted Zn-ribbon and HTH transcriptional regulator